MEQYFTYLVPLFTGITFVILLIGIIALFRGGKFNRNWSNRLMRMRVLSQFIVIMLILAASYFVVRK